MIRIGIQPFQFDFRGFLFQDNQLGIRFFGNRDNNRYQFNLQAIWRLYKDTNSGLNDITRKPRDDYILSANIFAQDFPLPGLTSLASFTANFNRETERELDHNGFPVRPALIGNLQNRNYDAFYVGYNADGRIGRMNISASAYGVFGSDRNNIFTGERARIEGFFAAVEPSYDANWARFRGAALFASGDDDPFNNVQRGFDFIFENPIFAGADTTAAAKELGRLGATLLDKSAPAEWRISVPVSKLRQLANIKQAKYLEPVSTDPVPEREPEPKPDPEDVFSNEHGRSNYLNSGFNGLLYNGEGVNVMVRENGMYKGPELQGRVISGSNEPGDPSSHASGVATYLGAGGNVNPRDRSNAWGANILGISGQNTYTLYDDPVKRIRVTNMSYGWPDELAGYNSLSREHDNFIRTRPEAMLVYSSGNDGGTVATGGKYNGITGWGNITGRAKHDQKPAGGERYGLRRQLSRLDLVNGPAYDGRSKTGAYHRRAGRHFYLPLPKVVGHLHHPAPGLTNRRKTPRWRRPH